MSHQDLPEGEGNRRSFIKNTAAAAMLLAAGDLPAWAAREAGASTPAAVAADGLPGGSLPWYRTVTRWGQVNITENDPARYDIAWWRDYWKRTRIKGIIVNAGGIVAYYPSKVPLHRRSDYLGGRDLFGEICHAAHEDGIAVFARMDSSRAHEEFHRAHPGWFAVDVEGKPYRAADLYSTCVNSPYYEEHIPAILREIAGLYKPEGFTDNSWSGLGRDSICYCEYCRKSFKDRTGFAIPVTKNWDDPAYRQWIRWNYDRRLEIWDLNNRATKGAGGPHCTWSGMNGGSVAGQSRSFRDFRQICRRADILMLDDQARTDAGGFQRNAETGQLIHGMLGWDKLIPESMAMYQAFRPVFRLSAKPEPEARMWMIEGIAGGIQPWWHMISAYHEDRRMHHSPEPMFRWHQANEAFLLDRQPVAAVGVVWSQQNTDFYGRDNTEELVDLPWRGVTQALVRARIPYLPLHADDIERDAAKFSVLVLPNLAVMTDGQIAAVRQFVERGGSLVATGESSLLDEWGDARADYALGDLFGAHRLQAPDPKGSKPAKLAGDVYHTYLRLGPGQRPAILHGFEETDILPYGGLLEPLRTDAGAEVLLTYIPQFPVFPPEKAWMQEPKTAIPGVILHRAHKDSRIAFLPADLDRQYARSNLPDHGNLLRNILRWAMKEEGSLQVEGVGLVDCHLYRQPHRLVLHLVNLSSPGAWRQPIDEFIPIGPLQVKVKLPPGVAGSQLRLLVSGQPVSGKVEKGWLRFQVSRVVDHEVVVIGDRSDSKI